MNHNLKVLGLSLFAVLAMGALSASAASAAEFHSESGTHTVLKASQTGEDVFSTNAGTVKCKEATYAGTQSGATATTVKVTPTYSECTAFGFVNNTIDVNGCSYELSGHSTNLVVACPAAPITVTAFNCWSTVGSQTIVGGITYTNTGTGSNRDLDLTLNLTGIKYTQHSKSFPGCTNGSFTNGTYTGAATAQGFNTEGRQVGIWRA